MAVAWFRNPVLDDSAPIIERHAVNERTFGIARTKRHPAYVYSINRNACLMHRIANVEIHFYAIVGPCSSKLGRLKRPAMIAHTVCGYAFALLPEKVRTCTVPKPDSVLCGRCHGEPPTFGKHGKGATGRIDKAKARVQLGCEVAGYPSALARDDAREK